MVLNSVSLNDAAVRMTCGKLVAPGTRLEKWVPGPTYETPCNASDHHSYLGIPSRSMLPALLTKFTIFSCNVSLLTRSSTLVCTSSDESQKVKFFKPGLLSISQAKTGLFWAETLGWNRMKMARMAKTEDGGLFLDAIFGVEGFVGLGLINRERGLKHMLYCSNP
ncbi:hypothetical protein Hanom_Chr10g00921081 [Helianthus anomalus]